MPLCPTGAIAAEPLRVDQGRCILCGRCVAERPDLFAWSQGATGPGAAALTREALVVPELPETDEVVAAARARLRARTAALRRSVHIRHVDAGSDGSEEWEIQALLGPVYDIHRLGVFFTASPRHADVLLVTGAGARGMAGPLRTTYDGMPDPKVVIAAGTDAVSGGLLSESEAVTGGIAAMVPVDVWLPGSPPSPFGILNALLIAVGKLADGGKGTRVSGLFAAGLILLAVAALADFIGGRFLRSMGSGPLYLLGAAGSACLATLGGFALAGRRVQLDVAGWLGDPVPGQQAAALSADRLSGLFLALTFGAAVPVSVAFASWAALARGGDPPEPPAPGGTHPPDPPWGGYPPPRSPRGLGASYALALGAVAVIMTARDAFTLLFGWETLTLAFYLLAGSERNKPGRAAAAQVTFAFGKVSGAALLIGLLLLATRSHSIMLASFAHVPGGAVRTTAYVLLLTGFAVKAGLVPFQIWLPRGYSAAPGPARAIMAGVCVNVAFYGMWRTLALLGRPPGWLAGVLLVLGALSALLGIAHAAVQNRLSRVIAYSSIENTGLIVTGFGVALTGAATGDRRLVAAGLLAATLQVVAHTVAKSLLFTSSAGIEAATGHDDLEELRGRARGTPWSGFGLAVGSLTLAGLPPTVGFVSEWFLLESLMQQFRVPGLGYRLVLALAGAAVALTVGFAGVTFVRIVGLICLGGNDPPRPPLLTGGLPAPRTPPGLGREGGDSRAGGVLPGDRGGDAAGDPGDRQGTVARGPGLAGYGRAEVPVGPAAGVRRVLDPVAVLAMGGDAADAAPGGAALLGRVRAATAAGAPRPGLALGDDRRRGR